ncbi:rerric reductase like transmembrane component [Aspergillus crustosus]
MSNSSWPWHFVSVTDAEKEHRRELLNLRGYYAQLSIIFAVILYRLYVTYFSQGQPQKKPVRGSRKKSWLDTPISEGWFETRRQYLVCFVWLGWLLGLSVWNTGDDYLHFTKALGHVGISQWPLQIAMSPAFYLSSTPRASSLLSILTTIPQPTLTAYHRLFARVVISPLLVGHAVMYSLFFLQSSHPDFSSLFFKRILDLDVQLGITAVTMAVAVMVFVRPKGKTGGIWKGTVGERRQAFYAAHLSLVGGMCIVAYFHVAQARVFVLESLVLSVVNLGCCYLTAK